MHLRRIAQFVFLAFAVSFFFPSTGYAAPLDKAANKKIDDAINTHYLGTDFKKALGVLEGTIEACGEKCSPAVLARAWMYIGIVKGAGMSDEKGAEEAFATALSIDPEVKLDKDLASDELITLFEESGGDASGSAAPPPATPSAPPGLASGEMTCTPDISELELRRPIPVACRSSKPATKAVIYYKEFGAPSYSQVTMTLSGSDWLGTVPCTATALQGEFTWFVTTSGSGGAVDSYGSEGDPKVISIVQSTTEAPPAHPGKPAPEACADAEDCPEEMRGTPTCPDVAAPSDRGDKGWGAGCKKHQECEVGLYCLAGSCESPPACETGADCDSGLCEDFLCKILEDDEGGGGGGGGGGKGPTNFIGLNFGLDLAAISGDYVCNPNPLTQVDAAGTPVAPGTGTDVAAAPPSTFACYVGETPYAVHPYADQLASGSIPSTLGPATMRVFLSYEHVFAEKFGVEAQAGLGFRGSPLSGIGQLIHVAVFGKYWFVGTGEGLRLYGALGGGLGQVDATADVSVVEFGSSLPATQGNDPNSSPQIRDPWATTYCGGPTAVCPITPVRAYKSLGQSFVGAGVGGLLNLGAVGIDIRLLGKFMLPVTGVVIQPTAGVVLPF